MRACALIGGMHFVRIAIFIQGFNLHWKWQPIYQSLIQYCVGSAKISICSSFRHICSFKIVQTIRCCRTLTKWWCWNFWKEQTASSRWKHPTMNMPTCQTMWPICDTCTKTMTLEKIQWPGKFSISFLVCIEMNENNVCKRAIYFLMLLSFQKVRARVGNPTATALRQFGLIHIRCVRKGSCQIHFLSTGHRTSVGG